MRALRQSPATRGCHCVAVSAHATQHAEAAIRAAGFDEFSKPCGVELMHQRLSELLRQA